MMTRFFLIILIMIGFASCKKHGATALIPLNGKNTPSTTFAVNEKITPMLMDDSYIVPIEVPTEMVSYDLNDYITSYHYIHLETNQGSLLGNITKLCADSSYLFIFDQQNNAVLRFSDEGKFLGNIGNIGRGPGEFMNLFDMSLNYQKHEICLLDLGVKKLLFYSYQGKFLYEQPLYFYYNDMEFLEDKLVLSTSFAHNTRVPAIDCNRLILSKADQSPIRKAFPYPEPLREQFHRVVSSPLKTFDNKVFYNHVLSDTIWEVRDSSSIARYVLKFPGRNNLFDSKTISKMSDDVYASIVGKANHFMGDYLQTEDALCFYLTKDNLITPLFYSKSSGRILYGSAFSHTPNCLFNKLLCNNFDFTLKDKSFVKIIQPFETLRFLKLLEEMKQPVSLSERDRAFVNKLNEEDNPVLLVVDLKKI